MMIKPRTIFNAIAIALTAATLSFAIPSYSSAQTQQAKAKWQEILPSRDRNNEEAQTIVRKVLDEDFKKYFNRADTSTYYANFFNTTGVEKNSVIIAVFTDPANCGNWGCMGYILKKNPGKDNTWRVLNIDNYNSILTAPELLAKSPSFYVLGPASAGYQRFNAATGAFEPSR